MKREVLPRVKNIKSFLYYVKKCGGRKQQINEFDPYRYELIRSKIYAAYGLTFAPFAALREISLHQTGLGKQGCNAFDRFINVFG